MLLRAFQQPILESSRGKIKPVDLQAERFVPVTHVASGRSLQQSSGDLMVADYM